MHRKTLNYILLFWTFSFLNGCGAVKDPVEVDLTHTPSKTLGELVILNQNQFYPQLRQALNRVGFRVPPFGSNSEITLKGQESDKKFAKAQAKIGVRHFGELSAFNPCITNRSAANFKKYELEIIDLERNETLMTISSGGWTENCPGYFLTMGHSKALFENLANGLAKNYEKIFSE